MESASNKFFPGAIERKVVCLMSRIGSRSRDGQFCKVYLMTVSQRVGRSFDSNQGSVNNRINDRADLYRRAEDARLRKKQNNVCVFQGECGLCKQRYQLAIRNEGRQVNKCAGLKDDKVRRNGENHRPGQQTDKEEGGYERTSILYKGNIQAFTCQCLSLLRSLDKCWEPKVKFGLGGPTINNLQWPDAHWSHRKGPNEV